MIDFGQIIAETMAPSKTEADAGGLAIRHWRTIFAQMHFRLQAAGATGEQSLAFMLAISQAIDRARGLELNDAECGALRDVLWSVFRGHPVRPHPPLAPRADFLMYVNS
jgi:hypothetical protein